MDSLTRPLSSSNSRCVTLGFLHHQRPLCLLRRFEQRSVKGKNGIPWRSISKQEDGTWWARGVTRRCRLRAILRTSIPNEGKRGRARFLLFQRNEEALRSTSPKMNRYGRIIGRAGTRRTGSTGKTALKQSCQMCRDEFLGKMGDGHRG